MEFKKYNSIENSYREKFLDKIKEFGHDDIDYCVTEKIHGANFSIWYDKDEFKLAKRSAFVGEGRRIDVDHSYIVGEKFYNYKDALEDDDILNKVNNIWNHLNLQNEDVLTVYGELFGGSYPHTEVERDNRFSMVQKGVSYHPKQKFIGFDIKVNGLYLPVNNFGEVCKESGLPYVEPLLIASLEECLKYPNKFQTTLPSKFLLPEIKDNFCEGVVIKPMVPKFFPNGERVILKNKNGAFEEVQKQRKPKPVTKVNEKLIPFINDVEDYITENRLRNVLSKIGQVTNKDFGKIAGAMSGDVMEDYLKDHDEFNDLDKNERKVVQKTIGKSIAKLIRDNFLNIIDGKF